VQFELDPTSRATLETIVRKVSQRSRRALVVDDDALLRAMLSDALVARGFEVLVAETGSRALEVLLDEVLGLDVLVTDLWMPKLDGESLARRIRIHGGEQELIIVLMTGRRPERDGWLSELKIDAMLDKAIGARAMAMAIEAQVEKRRGGGMPAAPNEVEVLRLSYPTAEALLDDAHTLQMGGAFAPGRKLSLQDEVRVHLVLPDGAVLRAMGNVVTVEEGGVGVSFELPATEREVLTTAIARAIEASLRSW
jgi:DNA-binding response OmpR family regulator